MRATTVIFFPFIALWKLITFIFELTGRLFACIFGFLILIVGMFFTFTVVGAIIGIPLMLFGILLLVRSIF